MVISHNKLENDGVFQISKRIYGGLESWFEAFVVSFFFLRKRIPYMYIPFVQKIPYMYNFTMNTQAGISFRLGTRVTQNLEAG